MVCYLGNTFCYAIQGEMKNESKPNHRSRGMITHADHPQSHLDLRSLSHPRPGVNRTYQELLKVIIFFREPSPSTFGARTAIPVYSHPEPLSAGVRDNVNISPKKVQVSPGESRRKKRWRGNTPVQLGKQTVKRITPSP